VNKSRGLELDLHVEIARGAGRRTLLEVTLRLTNTGGTHRIAVRLGEQVSPTVEFEVQQATE